MGHVKMVVLLSWVKNVVTLLLHQQAPFSWVRGCENVAELCSQRV